MNPYKKGDRVILKVDIKDEYGMIWYPKGSTMTVDRGWSNHDGSRGRTKYGVIFVESNGFGTKLENIEPTKQTKRDHLLRGILDDL